jgi:hypothetical protein
MSDLERRLAEDRMLRDAALALFKADFAFIRTDIAEKGVGARIAHRLGDGTRELLDDAVDYAEDNRGAVAAAIAAVVLWFARGPILDGLTRLFRDEDDNED